MSLHICSKIKKISLTVQSIELTQSEKMVELWFLFSTYCPMKLYSCSKFHENTDDHLKVKEWI